MFLMKLHLQKHASILKKSVSKAAGKSTARGCTTKIETMKHNFGENKIAFPFVILYQPNTWKWASGHVQDCLYGARKSANR